MRRLLVLLAATAWFLPAPASADVRLQMANGRVTLHATNATVRQILEEWARVGQTRIVNADKVPGGLVTLDLENVPEAEALETVLRSVSGYLAAPRATPAANLSHFDRIVVVATSAPSASAPGAPPARGSNDAAMQRPGFPNGFPGRPPFVAGGQPEVYTRPGADDQSDDGAPITNVAMPNRGAVFDRFQQQPQTVEPNDPNVTEPRAPQAQPLPPGQMIPNPPAAGAPGAATMPAGGASTPGVIVQPPQQQQPQGR
jgi:hypothetical protein